MDHVALTLDGAIADRPGVMRWMPPDQAATHRAADREQTTKTRTGRQTAHRSTQPAVPARP